MRMSTSVLSCFSSLQLVNPVIPVRIRVFPIRSNSCNITKLRPVQNLRIQNAFNVPKHIPIRLQNMIFRKEISQITSHPLLKLFDKEEIGKLCLIIPLISVGGFFFPTQISMAYGPHSQQFEQLIPEIGAEIVRLPHKISKSVKEPSGVVRVVDRNSGRPYFWVITDSGGPATVWATDENYNVKYALPIDVQNVDWEDIAVAPCKKGDDPVLLISDTGNNKRKRDKLQVYGVKLPPNLEEVIQEGDRDFGKEKYSTLEGATPVRTLDFKVPKKKLHPHDFDFEAIFVHQEKVWLLSKRRTEHSTGVFFLKDGLEYLNSNSDLSESAELKLKFVGESESGNPVTAADVSDDGKVLAVLTTSDIIFYNLENSHGDPLSVPIGRVSLNLKQTEGVSWMEPRILMVTNEEREAYFIKPNF